MEFVLTGLQWQTCLVYLDDVIVYGRDFDEHLEWLAEVFRQFYQAGLKLKPSVLPVTTQGAVHWSCDLRQRCQH